MISNFDVKSHKAQSVFSANNSENRLFYTDLNRNEDINMSHKMSKSPSAFTEVIRNQLFDSGATAWKHTAVSPYLALLKGAPTRFMAVHPPHPSVRWWQIRVSVWKHRLCLCFTVLFLAPSQVLQPDRVTCERFKDPTRVMWLQGENLSDEEKKTKKFPASRLSSSSVCRAALQSQLRWWQRLKSRRETFPGFPEAFLGTVHLPSSRRGITFRRLLGKGSLKGLVLKTCV